MKPTEPCSPAHFCPLPPMRQPSLHTRAHSTSQYMTLQTSHCKVNACSPPFSPHPCVLSRRIVIATCRPSPFRCRRNCSWTAPWPTRSTTCTLTWRRTRPTWCSPRRRSGCPWRRSRPSPPPPRRSWRPPPPPRTPARTPASPTWDWRPKSTRRRWDCDARCCRRDTRRARATCRSTQTLERTKWEKLSEDDIYVFLLSFFFFLNEGRRV